MIIIQSFALFDFGNPYITEGKLGDTEHIYLNFYSCLLSYATIKHLYPLQVIMVTNQKGYDTFIKYIPYDVIRIKENKHDYEFWNVYKIDALKEFDCDLIHIDYDVFLFNDLLGDFVDGTGDILVQDILPEEKNDVANFPRENKEFLAHKKIFTKEYDGRCFSCGVLGLRKHVRKKYFQAFDIIHGELLKFYKNNNSPLYGQIIIMEEMTLYLVAIENNHQVLDILPHEQMLKHNRVDVGDMVGYVHLMREAKYMKKHIELIRNVIRLNYSEYYQYILEYEEKVLKPLNITI